MNMLVISAIALPLSALLNGCVSGTPALTTPASLTTQPVNQVLSCPPQAQVNAVANAAAIVATDAGGAATVIALAADTAKLLEVGCVLYAASQ